jgi:uncharacterized protein (TIGR03067 family)
MRSVLLGTLLVTVATSALAAPAPFAKPERRTDLDKIRGEWDVVSEELNLRLDLGRGSSSIRYSPKRGGFKAVITGYRLLWCAEGRITSEEVVRLDKGKIDLTDSQSRVTRRGIYKLAGDVLVVCAWSDGRANRPSSLEPDQEGQTAYVLRRRR